MVVKSLLAKHLIAILTLDLLVHGMMLMLVVDQACLSHRVVAM